MIDIFKMVLNQNMMASLTKESQADLTIILLAFNEEIHIERCLKNAFQVARQVFVGKAFSLGCATVSLP